MKVSTSSDSAPESNQEFAALLHRVKSGSSDAAWELIDRYGPHVQRVVRRLLHRRLRPQFDSVDFVQAVWASFFQDPSQIHSFDSPDGVIGYLARMARNKVIEENRRQLGTEKNDLRRVKSLEDCQADDGNLVDHQPRPSQVAVAKERWNRLIEEQPDRNREVIRMRFMGMSFAEIGRRLGIDESRVRQIVARLLILQNGPADHHHSAS
ncbi:MAG: sigma-70 family RNA polymerase sigma factor [Pirellulales bacterium]|nr:sigma-70 family RNA polymerase sigma factor [Pirellulales bacterium]